jgi:putative transposase
MNPPRWDDLDSTHFRIAAQKVFTGTEAARCAPEGGRAPAHDAFTRLLQRQPPDTEALGQEAKAFGDVGKGLLVLDDPTLDKPYAQKMDRVTDPWSGQHPRVVKGIALLTLLWTEGKALIPCDFRVYDQPQGGKTQNESFQELRRKARGRGFTPEDVRMDSGYSSLKNRKRIASFGGFFLTRLKSNRLVNPDRQGNRPIREVEIPTEGRVAHRKGFGLVRVFRTVSPNRDAEYGATNDLKMTEEKREELEKKGWGMEVDPRGLKPCGGVEQAHVRKAVSILGHWPLALRAFLRLEAYRLRTGVSGDEAQAAYPPGGHPPLLGSSPLCPPANCVTPIEPEPKEEGAGAAGLKENRKPGGSNGPH